MTREQEKRCNKVRRMCWGKIKYNTGEEADSYGKLYNYRHKESLPYRAYFCEVCLKWHLTTKPKLAKVV